MKIISVIAAVLLSAVAVQVKANPIMSGGKISLSGSSYQQQRVTPKPMSQPATRSSTSRVNPDYPEELFILETYNIGPMVYGTLWNNTEQAIRNIEVTAYVGIDSPYEHSQTYTHSGLLAPGVKISVPVRVRSASAGNALRTSQMVIRDFTVRH